jgi:hypothetical protein
MAEEVGLYVRYGDGGRELLYMTPVNENRYRLEVTSICGHLRYGDTIEVGTPLADGSVPYRRIVKRSGLKTHCFILSQGLLESPRICSLWERIDSLGGHCEGVAGGVFVVHLPRDCQLDVGREIDEVLGISTLRRRIRNWKWRLKRANGWLLGLR